MKSKVSLLIGLVAVAAFALIGLAHREAHAAPQSCSLVMSNGNFALQVIASGQWQTYAGTLPEVAAAAKDLVQAGICSF